MNEPSLVTVNGQRAKVQSTDGGAPYKFEAPVDLDAGANTVVVEAKDGRNNTSTKTYSVTTTGDSKKYEYDLNENLRWEKLPNDTVVREYRWDQQNRLVRVIEGTHESVYEYDGASRRWRITEKENGTQTKQETFVWCGSRICQKRSGGAVARSYFGNGFQEGGSAKYFTTRDHLGSVREVVGSDGTTISSRLWYDPWGKVTETSSGAKSDFTYTGHYFDRPTGLDLTRYRAYDARLGRWISRDPIGLRGGLNLYGSVENNPTKYIDVDGLLPDDRYPGMPQDEIAAAQWGSGWAAAAFAAVSGITGATSAAWGWLWGGSELAANVATTAAAVTVPEAAAGGACGTGVAAATRSAKIDPAKFGYLFGNAGGNAHNIARTAQNAGQMARLGLFNNAEGRALLQQHFDGVVADSSNIIGVFSNQYGNFVVRESLLAGPGGFVKFESTWQVLGDGSYRFTTAIPIGGP